MGSRVKLPYRSGGEEERGVKAEERCLCSWEGVQEASAKLLGDRRGWQEVRGGRGGGRWYCQLLGGRELWPSCPSWERQPPFIFPGQGLKSRRWSLVWGKEGSGPLGNLLGGLRPFPQRNACLTLHLSLWRRISGVLWIQLGVFHSS